MHATVRCLKSLRAQILQGCAGILEDKLCDYNFNIYEILLDIKGQRKDPLSSSQPRMNMKNEEMMLSASILAQLAI
jgi:hypothetical protein